MTHKELQNLKVGDLVFTSEDYPDVTPNKKYPVEVDDDGDYYFVDNFHEDNYNINFNYKNFSLFKKNSRTKQVVDFSNLPEEATEIVISGIRYKKVVETIVKWETA